MTSFVPLLFITNLWTATQRPAPARIISPFLIGPALFPSRPQSAGWTSTATPGPLAAVGMQPGDGVDPEMMRRLGPVRQGQHQPADLVGLGAQGRRRDCSIIVGPKQQRHKAATEKKGLKLAQGGIVCRTNPVALYAEVELKILDGRHPRHEPAGGHIRILATQDRNRGRFVQSLAQPDR